MREKLSSRLGFILLSAGCAIGLGNVWRFPYIAGQNGGGWFVVIFLVLVGLPVLTMEFAARRAAQRPIARLHEVLTLEKLGWRLHGVAGMLGNVLLMMFYTTVTGWMLNYFWKNATGAFVGLAPADIGAGFVGVTSNPVIQIVAMLAVTLSAASVCAVGLVTLPNVFNHMPSGRFGGLIFFLFMSIAALTTVLAVFENILAILRELEGECRAQ